MHPKAAAAAANAPAAELVRVPSAAIVASRAPPTHAALSLGLLLEIAPIYLVATAILAGDALGVCRIAVPLWLAAMLATTAAALFMRGMTLAANVVAMVAIAAAVSMPARDAVAPPFSAHGIRNFSDGAAVTLEGRINRGSQQYPDREYVFVNVERAGVGASNLRAASGTVRLTVVGEHAHVRVGDEVRVAGLLRFARNFGDPGEFDYVGYLARQGIAATMVLNARGRDPLVVIGYRREFPASQVAAVRARIGAFIDANLTGEERAEMRALVIGDRGGIGDALRQRFALTGLAHMLVISGLHLGFVAAAAFGMVRLLMMLFPGLTARGYANKAAALAASTYAAIAMPHVSTARALVMVLAYALAVIANRARTAGEPGTRGDRDMPGAAGIDRRYRVPAFVRLGARDRARDAPIRTVVAAANRSTRHGGSYARVDAARRRCDCGLRRRLVLGVDGRCAADRLSLQPVLGGRRDR